jgi:hypothetical protein
VLRKPQKHRSRESNRKREREREMKREMKREGERKFLRSAREMFANITVSGLTSGAKYNLLRYEHKGVPDRGFACPSQRTEPSMCMPTHTPSTPILIPLACGLCLDEPNGRHNTSHVVTCTDLLKQISTSPLPLHGTLIHRAQKKLY